MVAGIFLERKASFCKILFFKICIKRRCYISCRENTGKFLTDFKKHFSVLSGTAVGGLICFLRMSRRKAVSGFARVYLSVMRGTPILVLLVISLLKMTSIVGYIAVIDMAKASDIIRTRTSDTFFPLIAIIYFLKNRNFNVE